MQVTTVKADGPHAFTVNGGSSTAFNNVRFEASGGASLIFTSMLKMITSMTFSGVTELVRLHRGWMGGWWVGECWSDGARIF